MVGNKLLCLVCPVISLSHSLPHIQGKALGVICEERVLFSRDEVWSAYSWSGTSFTAVREALIEEIREMDRLE